MDNRKLHFTPDGYISVDGEGYLPIVTPFTTDAFRGKYGEVRPDVVENARKIVHRWNSCSEMLQQLIEYHKACDILAAMLTQRDKDFFLSESGRPWEAMKKGHEMIERLSSKT